MRNSNKIILFLLFIFACTNGYTQKIEDRIQALEQNDLVNIWIEKNIEDTSKINIILENLKDDTIYIKSSFLFNDETNLSYILLYTCTNINSNINEKELSYTQMLKDSLLCGYETSILPVVLKFSDNFITLKPQSQIELPLNYKFKNRMVCIRMQIIGGYKNKNFILKKESNIIYVK